MRSAEMFLEVPVITLREGFDTGLAAEHPLPGFLFQRAPSVVSFGRPVALDLIGQEFAPSK